MSPWKDDAPVWRDDEFWANVPASDLDDPVELDAEVVAEPDSPE